MNNATRLAFLFLAAVPVTLLVLGGKSPKAESPFSSQAKRGQYLVQFGACSDCHTPKKMGARGPEDDPARGKPAAEPEKK